MYCLLYSIGIKLCKYRRQTKGKTPPLKTYTIPLDKCMLLYRVKHGILIQRYSINFFANKGSTTNILWCKNRK